MWCVHRCQVCDYKSQFSDCFCGFLIGTQCRSNLIFCACVRIAENLSVLRLQKVGNSQSLQAQLYTLDQYSSDQLAEDGAAPENFNVDVVTDFEIPISRFPRPLPALTRTALHQDPVPEMPRIVYAFGQVRLRPELKCSLDFERRFEKCGFTEHSWPLDHSAPGVVIDKKSIYEKSPRHQKLSTLEIVFLGKNHEFHKVAFCEFPAICSPWRHPMVLPIWPYGNHSPSSDSLRLGNRRLNNLECTLTSH